MTVGIPTYSVQCDEEGCYNKATFLLAQPCPGIYEIPAVDAVYAHFGGETLPDGKHRCAECRAKYTRTPPVADIARNLDIITNTPGAFTRWTRIWRALYSRPLHETMMRVVVEKAQEYLTTEQTAHYRSMALQEKADALNEALKNLTISNALETLNGRIRS